MAPKFLSLSLSMVCLVQIVSADSPVITNGTDWKDTDGNPIVSRNTITTECADFQSVGRGVIGADSDRAPRFRTVRLRE